MADEEGRSDTLSRLSGVLLEETKLDVVLSLVAGLAKETIPGAASVSVTLVQDGQMTTPASSDPDAPCIDQAQYERGDGPCIDAAMSGREIHVRDMRQEARWPHVQAEALALGMESMLSLPLTVNGSLLGALNCYSRRLGGLLPEEVEQGRQFAEHARVLLANAQAFARSEQRNEQLREALASRDVIGQAKGILMEREGVPADRAFDILRRASQRSNIKLRELAEQLTQRRQGESGDSRTASRREEEPSRTWP
jgi:GAF domain-containing protein